MRLNKYVALASGISRRASDRAIEEGRVQINGHVAMLGQEVAPSDTVLLDDLAITPPVKTTTIILNKPTGYICSRNGQGSKTIYDLLPPPLHNLKPVGRLDKDSSGLLLMTNDGDLAHELTHPSKRKTKLYHVTLDHALAPLHQQMISDIGVQLEDGPSKFQLERMHEGDNKQWRVTMHEGRTRQIRRTFAALGYKVTGLHRTDFGPYTLNRVAAGNYTELEP
jgi:23S rRNA pseudouridine2605 synthase